MIITIELTTEEFDLLKAVLGAMPVVYGDGMASDKLQALRDKIESYGPDQETSR